MYVCINTPYLSGFYTCAKVDIISNVYNELSGLGSLRQTFVDAREVDEPIILDGVRQRMEENVKMKEQAYGQNSFMAIGKSSCAPTGIDLHQAP